MQCNPFVLEKWGDRKTLGLKVLSKDLFLLKDVDGLSRNYGLLCFQP